jgi:hypothetical protein
MKGRWPITVTVALLTVATVASAPRSWASTQEGWIHVASPNVGSRGSDLFGVAATSETDAWAVGASFPATAVRTLVEHWDGTAWSVVPSPNVGSEDNNLFGAAATSSTDAWAVGNYTIDGGSVGQTLIEHWNGVAWSVIPSPNVGAGTNGLNGVSAISEHNAWAVGSYWNGNVAQSLIEHWNGKAWSVVPSPNVGRGRNFLNAVSARSSTNAWAVGSHSGRYETRALIEHWNGTAWHVKPSPNVGGNNRLNGVVTISKYVVWAVGSYSAPAGGSTLIERWNPGLRAWSVVRSDNVGPGENDLFGVAATSSRNVWAVGRYQEFRSGYRTLIEHWDPRSLSWSVTSSPSIGRGDNILLAVAATSESDIWAAGDDWDIRRSTDRTLIEHCC